MIRSLTLLAAAALCCAGAQAQNQLQISGLLDVSDLMILNAGAPVPASLEEALVAALEIRPDSITLDYLDLYGLRPAVEQIKAAGIVARVASPRVLKPQEQRIVNFLLRLDCPIVLLTARNSRLLMTRPLPTPIWVNMP